MRDRGLELLLICTLMVVAAGPGEAGMTATTTRTSVGPTRLLSPSFGYSVQYRTVTRGGTPQTTTRLFLYTPRGWRNATPPFDGHADTVDDVAFADPRHGWVAAFDCARAAVYVYRTRDGGRSWQSLGSPATHSCGGGPTFLSFVDADNGWMEPVSPNGPGGELLRTRDGGRTWTQVASADTPKPSLPCLAPIEFVSRTAGWMSRCGSVVFAGRDGGRRWARVSIRTRARHATRTFDMPRFFGRAGVVAATVGARAVRAVAFSTSNDGGSTWSPGSLRAISRCTFRPVLVFDGVWPVGIARSRVWWVVDASRRVVQITTDAGRRWHAVHARGLPNRPCAVTEVSAVGARVAWVVARSGTDSDTALFATRDGGHTWRRLTLLR